MSRTWTLAVVLVVSLIVALPAAAAPNGPKAPTACDPLAGTWAAGPNPDTVLVRAWGNFFPANGKFYTLGGRSSDAAGSDLQNPREYDPATNTWTVKTGAFPDNQMNNMVGGVLDFGTGPVIVVVGGSAAGATTASNTTKVYDPVADSVTVLASDNWIGNDTGTKLPGGAAVYNNKLYVFGGFEINVGMITGIWEFDPMAAAGSRWTAKTAVLPVAHGYIPTAAIGNYIYLAGGATWDGTTLVDSSDVYRYDPVADSITTLASLPQATGETRAVRMLDNKLWVLGGGRTAPNPSNVVQVYDPATDTWSTGPAFVNARRNFPADIDPATGKIYLVGGYDTSGVTPIDLMEIFTLCVPTSVNVTALQASSGAAYGLLALGAVIGIAAAAVLLRRARR